VRAPNGSDRSVFRVPDAGAGIRVVLTSCSAKASVKTSGSVLGRFERHTDVFVVSLADLLPPCANFLIVRPSDTEVRSAVV